jgi:PKHD-type hydroxylase
MNDKTSFSGWGFEPEIVNDFGLVPGVFSDYECDRIVEYGEERNLQAAGVGGRGEKVKEVRDSSITWIQPNDDSAAWIYRRVTDAIKEVNEQVFKFDLWGFLEALQFTRYDAPGGKYDTHVDRFNGGMVIRKLSCTTLLTDPSAFEGGDLDVWVCGKPMSMVKQRGALIAFPSFILHAVKPVTQGTRHSLVGWVAGKPFK